MPENAVVEFKVAFNSKEAAQQFQQDFTRIQGSLYKKSLQQETETRKKADSQAARAAEELIARRKRLVIDGMQDEHKRRVKFIQLEYDEQRRRIKQLLKMRLDANEITEKQMRRQLQSFERALAVARDRQIQASRSSSLMSGLRDAAYQIPGVGRFAGMGVAAGSVAVGAGLAKGLQESIRLAISFQDEMTEVKKTTGLAGQELDNLGEGLLGLSARLGIAQSDLTSIAAIAGQLGISGVDNILALTETVAKLAAVSDLSSEEAGNAIAKIGKAFDVPIEQSDKLGSVINELSNKTAATARDIVDALVHVGTAGSRLGFTADQVAAITATLIDAGIRAETAGNSMKNVFTRMQTESVKLAKVAGVTREEFLAMIDRDALGALRTYLAGLSVLPSHLQAIHIKETFGDENLLAVATLAEQTDNLNKNLVTSQKAFEDGRSLANEFAASLDSASKQWNIFTARLTRAATRLGSAFVPVITSVLKALNSFGRESTELAEEVSKLTDEITQLDHIEGLINRFEELSKKTNRSAEETAELERITGELNERYPQYIDRTQDVEGAVRVYASSLRAAVRAQRALATAQKEGDLDDLVDNYRTAIRMIDHLRETAEKYEEQAADPEYIASLERRLRASGVFSLDVETYVRERTDRNAKMIDEWEAKLRSRVRALAALFDTGEGLDEQALLDALVSQNIALEDARRLVERLKREYTALLKLEPEKTDLDPDDDPTITGDGGAARIKAAEELSRILEDITVQRIEDETARQLAEIELRYERERARIAELAEEARKVAGANAEKIGQDEQAILDSYAALEKQEREKVLRERGEREQKAREKLAEQELKREKEVISEELKMTLDALDQEVDAELEAIKETEKAQEEAFERRLRLVRRFTDAFVDLAFDELTRQPDMTDAQIDIQRLQFDEEEKALTKSLRSREISQKEYDLRMRALAEERAAFEKEVERDKAGFIERTYREMGGVAIEIVKDWLKNEIALKLASLKIHEGFELKKTAATIAGVAERAAAVATEVAKDLYGAAASIVNAVANAVKWMANKFGPLALLAIPALGAAAYVGFQGVKKTFGFASGGGVLPRGGGYTGPGPRYQSAGVDLVEYHRGEVVMEEPIVRGQLKEWLTLRRLAQRGVKISHLLSVAGIPTNEGSYASGGLVEASRVLAPPVNVLPGSIDLSPLIHENEQTRVEYERTRLELKSMRRELRMLAERPQKLIVNRRLARRITDEAERYTALQTPGRIPR